jgi:hypothetical protein
MKVFFSLFISMLLLSMDVATGEYFLTGIATIDNKVIANDTLFCTSSVTLPKNRTV